MIRKGYLKKLFFMIQGLLILLTLCIGGIILWYARKTVGGEIIDLNRSVLKQVTENGSRVMNDARNLGRELSYDNEVIEFLSAGGGSARKEELARSIDKKIYNNLLANFDQRRLFETAVIGYHGDLFLTYQPLFLDLDMDALDSLMEGREERFLATTAYPEEKGVHRFSFRLVRVVEEHLTGEKLGYIIMNISELALYDSYKDIQTSDRTFRVADQQGIVLSAKDKREIGSKYLELETQRFDGQESGQIVSLYDKKNPGYLYHRLEGTDWYLIETVPLDALWSSLGRIQLFILAVMAAAVASVVLVTRHLYRETVIPVIQIKEKMEQVAGGDLAVRVQVDREDEFGQIGKAFNYMVKRIRSLLDEMKLVEKKKRSAELDFLKAQINPHFIYNTLSSIRFNVEMNRNDKAESMLYDFSALLRRTLSKSGEFVTVRAELEVLKHYVSLQSFRYEDKFYISYEIEPESTDCLLPGMILQPIMENAIFFSVAEDQVNHIEVSVKIKDDTLILAIKDEGIGMSEEKIQSVLYQDVGMSHVGLRNIQERIQLIYGSKYGLEINSVCGAGTTVQIHIPARHGLQEGESPDEDISRR